MLLSSAAWVHLASLAREPVVTAYFRNSNNQENPMISYSGQWREAISELAVHAGWATASGGVGGFLSAAVLSLFGRGRSGPVDYASEALHAVCVRDQTAAGALLCMAASAELEEHLRASLLQALLHTLKSRHSSSRLLTAVINRPAILKQLHSFAAGALQPVPRAGAVVSAVFDHLLEKAAAEPTNFQVRQVCVMFALLSPCARGQEALTSSVAPGQRSTCFSPP